MKLAVLPASADFWSEPMIPETTRRKETPSAAKTRARVLVVDDEPLVQWALATSLAAAGYEVVTAQTALEARQIAAMVPQPDIVLLDLRPQDVNGGVFFDEIRMVAPDCRFLVLSTERRGDAPPAWEGIQVIEKPFDLAEVARLVDESLRQPPLRR
jgi:DNA-binding NtrC family response regulator